MVKRGPLEIVEGFYVAHIVYNLHRLSVFERLARGDTIAEIARELRYDAALLNTLLEFIYQATDILRHKDNDNYSINPQYLPYRQLGFHLDKFIGAYGQAFVRLQDSLSSPALGREFVDDKMLAEAFAKVETANRSAIAGLIREWKVNSLLDLGCGPAALLQELGAEDPTFKGWGMDSSRAMCQIAKKKISAAGLAGRLQIINADVRQLGKHLRPPLRQQVGALHMRSLLNEFFRFGVDPAVSFLQNLKTLFPERMLFVIDYYGKLTWTRRVQPHHRHTLLHDLAQVISSQGVPPPDLQKWESIYHAAECSLVHAYEGENDGLEWFIHMVQL